MTTIQGRILYFQVEIGTPAPIQKNTEETQYPLCVITKFIIKMRLKIVSPPLIPKRDQSVSNSTNINNPPCIHLWFKNSSMPLPLLCPPAHNEPIFERKPFTHTISHTRTCRYIPHSGCVICKLEECLFLTYNGSWGRSSGFELL